ncbi:MAG: glucosaminidase domain-containing protein [Bacteroidota bacterium]
MKKWKNGIVFLLLTLSISSQAQQQETINNYISQFKDIAIAEMKRTGVPAAITLAQGIHESGAGNSKLVLESNNHFGIKCKSNWTGESVKHDDDAKGECFRKYPAPEDSYRDHSDFLKNSQRYASLFSLDPADYEGWANGLKKAGYATNPKYPQVLIKLIEDYQLQAYTSLALRKTFPNGDVLVNNNSQGDMTTPVQNPTLPIEPATAIINTPTYPAGQFVINDTKVVFVKKGTSFLAIAKQYDVDLSKIFEFNEIPLAEVTEKDQLIYLQRKQKKGATEFHFVRPGESLADIARQEAIRLESLKELNGLKDDEQPAAGERLHLQSKSSSMPKLAGNKNYSMPAVKNQGTH